MRKTVFTLIALFAVLTTNAQNVKFAHVSSYEVLDSIQSYKDIQAESAKIQNDAQDAYKGIEAEMIKIQAEAEAGIDTLSDFEIQMIQSTLQQKQGFIQQLELNTQKQIQVLEERMFKLTEMYREAVKVVADKEGITYVFDDQSGLVYAGDSGVNLTDKVRSELLKMDNASPVHRF